MFIHCWGLDSNTLNKHCNNQGLCQSAEGYLAPGTRMGFAKPSAGCSASLQDVKDEDYHTVYTYGH